MIDIYGTMGPACMQLETLREMFRLGMTGMRLNLSHISLKQSEEMLRLFHRAASQAGVEPKLLIDLQGPELRIGPLEEALLLVEGEFIYFGKDPDRAQILIPEEALPECREGQELLLDDGKLLLLVCESVDDALFQAKVLRGGLLTGRKSLALPGKEISMPALTKADLENLRRAKSCGVTGIMQPFVRSRQDLQDVKTAMSYAGCPDLSLLAKIENQNGLRHLQEFFEVADEIVIARGDLGNAMPLWELPRRQKEIAKACNKAGVPFMVVTQMLASMEHQAVPTRAEVSDIYNAILDGAGSVMVTGETATGDYPIEVIRYLVNTVKEAVK